MVEEAPAASPSKSPLSWLKPIMGFAVQNAAAKGFTKTAYAI